MPPSRSGVSPPVIGPDNYPSSNPLPLMKLGMRHCRFPVTPLCGVDGTLYCADTTRDERTSWCPHHCGVVFDKSVPIRGHNRPFITPDKRVAKKLLPPANVR